MNRSSASRWSVALRRILPGLRRAGVLATMLAAATASAQDPRESVLIGDQPARSIVGHAMSADGTIVAYARTRVGSTRSDIYTLDLRASSGEIVRRRITSSNTTKAFPSLNGAGTRVAWVEGSSGSPWLVGRVDLAPGSSPQWVALPAGAVPTGARISPDGSRVAVTTQEGSVQKLHIVFGGPTLTLSANQLTMAPAGQVWWKDSSGLVVSRRIVNQLGTIGPRIVSVSASTGAATDVTCGNTDRMATVTSTTPAMVRYLRTVPVLPGGTLVMSINQGAACNTASQLMDMGTSAVASAATSLDGLHVVMAAQSSGSYEVIDLTGGFLVPLTDRNLRSAPLAPWADEDGDYAIFGQPDGGTRSLLWAINVNKSVTTMPDTGLCPVPPFDVPKAGCQLADDYPVHPFLECSTWIDNGTWGDGNVLFFEEATGDEGFTATRGPRVVPRELNGSTRVDTKYTVLCKPTQDVVTRVTVIDPLAVQDDVVTAEGFGHIVYECFDPFP